MSPLQRWRRRARELKVQLPAIGFALRHPRTPRFAKVLAVISVAYAISPVDLIPDFIPLLGYLDDLLLLPAGVALFIRLVPRDVWTECKQRAEDGSPAASEAGLLAAGVIILLWLGIVVGFGRTVLGLMRSRE